MTIVNFDMISIQCSWISLGKSYIIAKMHIKLNKTLPTRINFTHWGDRLHPRLNKWLKINTFWFSGGRMFSLLTFIIGAIFNLFKSKKELIIQSCLQKKEIEILRRQNHKKRLNLNHSDRIIFSVLNRIGNIKETISILKPETVLR
jgi:hypothetical protein